MVDPFSFLFILSGIILCSWSTNWNFISSQNQKITIVVWFRSLSSIRTDHRSVPTCINSVANQTENEWILSDEHTVQVKMNKLIFEELVKDLSNQTIFVLLLGGEPDVISVQQISFRADFQTFSVTLYRSKANRWSNLEPNRSDFLWLSSECHWSRKTEFLFFSRRQ